jgi:hypothetical protein
VSPVNTRARIFVSHSAKERQAQAVQIAIVTELEKPERMTRFGLLLDKVTLEPGDLWRSRINLWVGGCDAAVIILSRAALESPYVAYEVSILSYRVAMGDSLLLIPILLEDVSVEDLKKSRLSPAQLAELQTVQGNGKSATEIAQEVVAKLEKSVLTPGETPIERRARGLAGELDVFDPVHLEKAASFLDCQIDCWIPDVQGKLRLRLAIQLLSVGMNGAIDALLSLRDSLPSILTKQQKSEWMQRVSEYVASSWVDARSVERLPTIAKGETAISAVGLNISHLVSMTMYVHCASSQDQFPGTWYQSFCDGVVGEDRIEQVVKRLIEKLERVLAACLACQLEEVREELARMNSRRRQAIVVALPVDGLSDEILKALSRELPQVTFFLLLGVLNTGGAKLSEETVEILFPELTSGYETRFLQDYQDFWATIRVR